jgi:hypothetical protein
VPTRNTPQPPARHTPQPAARHTPQPPTRPTPPRYEAQTRSPDELTIAPRVLAESEDTNIAAPVYVEHDVAPRVYAETQALDDATIPPQVYAETSQPSYASTPPPAYTETPPPSYMNTPSHAQWQTPLPGQASAPHTYAPATYPSVPTGSVQTAPTPKLPDAPRSGGSLKVLLVVASLVVMMGGGLALGWVFFARDDGADRETASANQPPAPQVQVPTPTAPAQAAAPAPTPAAKKEEPKPATAIAEITSLDHPVLQDIVSPVRGEVSAVSVSTPREVKLGENLFTIRYRRSGGSRAAALVKRIAELETLAQEDPGAYEPFLARARRDLKQLQRVDTSTVNASAPGLVASQVKVGDDVEAGATLGTVLDGRTWVAVATVQGAEPTANWSCVVATPDNKHTAACKIQTTEAITEGGGTRVTVEISTTGTSWLDGLKLQQRLVLEPPNAR